MFYHMWVGDNTDCYINKIKQIDSINYYKLYYLNIYTK